MKIRVVASLCVAAVLAVGAFVLLGGNRPMPAGRRLVAARARAQAAEAEGRNRGADAADGASLDAELTARLGAPADQYAAAVAARAQLARKGPAVPGGRGRWRPAAAGPLVADAPQYPVSATSGYS